MQDLRVVHVPVLEKHHHDDDVLYDGTAATATAAATRTAMHGFLASLLATTAATGHSIRGFDVVVDNAKTKESAQKWNKRYSITSGDEDEKSVDSRWSQSTSSSTSMLMQPRRHSLTIAPIRSLSPTECSNGCGPEQQQQELHERELTQELQLHLLDRNLFSMPMPPPPPPPPRRHSIQSCQTPQYNHLLTAKNLALNLVQSKAKSLDSSTNDEAWSDVELPQHDSFGPSATSFSTSQSTSPSTCTAIPNLTSPASPEESPIPTQQHVEYSEDENWISDTDRSNNADVGTDYTDCTDLESEEEYTHALSALNNSALDPPKCKDSALSMALIQTIERLSVRAALSLSRPHHSPNARMKTMDVIHEAMELLPSKGVVSDVVVSSTNRRRSTYLRSSFNNRTPNRNRNRNPESDSESEADTDTAMLTREAGQEKPQDYIVTNAMLQAIDRLAVRAALTLTSSEDSEA